MVTFDLTIVRKYRVGGKREVNMYVFFLLPLLSADRLNVKAVNNRCHQVNKTLQVGFIYIYLL